MIKKIMITLICVLILPIVVNADMGAPEITSYDVLVTNPNGAQAYDYDGKKLDKIFDFNDSLTIIMEISIDGKVYLGVDYEESDEDRNSYYINENDVNIDGEVNLDKFNKQEGKLYVFDEGAELYKGPSKKYGIIENSEIPIGTTLTYEYSDEMWAYVKYNGKKGWVYKYSFEGFSPYEDLESSVCSFTEANLIVMKEDIELYEKPNLDSNKQKVTIPRNTIITADKTFSRYPKSSFEYIKYGEYEGWVYVDENSEFFGYEPYNNENDIFKVLTIDSINLTEYIDSKENITVIPKGEKLELKNYYMYEKDIYDGDDSDSYYFIEYKGKKGWVRSDKFASYQDSKLLTLKDVELNSDLNSQDIQSTLKQYEEIEGYYSYSNYSDDESYYYIENDNVKGWVSNKDNKFAYSSTCTQYFIIDKDGEVLYTLSGKIADIPYHAILTELFHYYDESNIRKSIVSYKGEKYILDTEYVGESVYYSKYKYYDETDPNANLKVYSDEMLEKIDFEIPNGAEIDVLFRYGCCDFERFYISYEGKKGWILYDWNKFRTIDLERKECLINENLEVEYKEDSKPISTPQKNTDSKLIVFTCVIVAVALGLSALVTILYINKNNKKNNIETAEEEVLKELKQQEDNNKE